MPPRNVSQIESDHVTFATARPRGVVTLVANRVLSISLTSINREQGSPASLLSRSSAETRARRTDGKSMWKAVESRKKKKKRNIPNSEKLSSAHTCLPRFNSREKEILFNIVDMRIWSHSLYDQKPKTLSSTFVKIRNPPFFLSKARYFNRADKVYVSRALIKGILKRRQT